MAREFAEQIAKMPSSERTGRVFKLLGLRGEERDVRSNWVSQIVTRISMAVGDMVNVDDWTGKVKCAGVHDLRLSFGIRWALRGKPQQLMLIMRHESFETTLDYYVGDQRRDTSSAMWALTDYSN